MAAKLGAVGLTSLVPFLTAGGNYAPAFFIGAGLALGALASIWILCPKIEPLRAKR
jgi:ACS family hexuronate transporter-like MFS transporter